MLKPFYIDFKKKKQTKFDTKSDFDYVKVKNDRFQIYKSLQGP